uniref:Uncharacterized protein n=1 Tax=Panagrolaimus sp. JU765 TaxID=591449 RepID=A0AC34R725_9BILA
MSPIITLPGTIWLSWNSARLVSLILNSLTGSLLFYEQQQSILTPDFIFCLRIIEGQLNQLYIHLKDHGHHKDIFVAIRNLSNKASDLASKANEKFKTEDQHRISLERLLENEFNFKLSTAKLIDDRLRWHVKEHFVQQKERNWFDSGNDEVFR